MTTILGPLPCSHCGAPVVWDRFRGEHALLERRGKGRKHRHACVCGAWMPLVKERCARTPGHAESHRRRVVMDDDAAARRKWRAAA